MLNRHSANLGQTGALPTPPQMVNRCISPRARISRQETKPSGLPRETGVQTRTSRLTAISRGSSILMIAIRRRWIGSTRCLARYDIPTCHMYESLEASCPTSQSKSLLASRLADETSHGKGRSATERTLAAFIQFKEVPANRRQLLCPGSRSVAVCTFAGFSRSLSEPLPAAAWGLHHVSR